jgi:hypothetical protein
VDNAVADVATSAAPRRVPCIGSVDHKPRVRGAAGVEPGGAVDCTGARVAVWASLNDASMDGGSGVAVVVLCHVLDRWTAIPLLGDYGSQPNTWAAHMAKGRGGLALGVPNEIVLLVD